MTKMTKQYRETNSSSLHTGHRVDSRHYKEGDPPHKEFDFPSPYGWPSDLDSLISRTVAELTLREIFWGDTKPKESADRYYPKQHPDDIKRKKEFRMSLHSLIANGGKVIVIGGRMNPLWHRFNNDPRVEFWTGDRSEIERHFTKGNNSLPTNTHGVILSRFVSHTTTSKILDEARRRHLTIMGPKNDGEVTKLLEQIMTPPPTTQEDTPAPKPEKVEPPKSLRSPHKGELSEWVKSSDDATKTIKESSEYIMKKMNEAGVTTTWPSLQNSIGSMRRTAGVFAKPGLSKVMKERFEEKRSESTSTEQGHPPLPKPLPPPPPPPPPPSAPMEDGTLALLKMIEDLQAGLSLLPETVKRMHEQNKEYRQLEAKLAELGFIRK